MKTHSEIIKEIEDRIFEEEEERKNIQKHNELICTVLTVFSAVLFYQNAKEALFVVAYYTLFVFIAIYIIETIMAAAKCEYTTIISSFDILVEIFSGHKYAAAIFIGFFIGTTLHIGIL